MWLHIWSLQTDEERAFRDAKKSAMNLEPLEYVQDGALQRMDQLISVCFGENKIRPMGYFVTPNQKMGSGQPVREGEAALIVLKCWDQAKCFDAEILVQRMYSIWL